VAGSIAELNKWGIYHRNICFDNFKKVGHKFKLFCIEEALFIPSSKKVKSG